MTEAKLLPCPFCGGPVELERTIDRREWWGVVCRNTKNLGGTCAIQQRPSASEAAAVERWNTRAPHPALEKILREAKTANEVIRLGRSREGSGHTTVATVLHRIEKAAAKALGRND